MQLDDPGNSKQKCQPALCEELPMALSQERLWNEGNLKISQLIFYLTTLTDICQLHGPLRWALTDTRHIYI